MNRTIKAATAHRRPRRGVLCLMALSAVMPLLAASPQPAPADLSGFWEVSAGDWTLPATAKLTPTAQGFEKKLADERAHGRVMVYSSRWCTLFGMPFMMGQSPPIDIVQSPQLIGIYTEQNALARYIYLDGRAHPDRAAYQATTNGQSVGHWEGGQLLVDTSNFSAQGHLTIPGGGYRTRSSHLVERFRLTDAGKTLQIDYRWDDPAVYLEPHTYTLTYHRLPAQTYAFEDFCDASDPAPYLNSGGVSDEPGDGAQ